MSMTPAHQIADHPDDQCECGDRRSDHKDGGPCRFNSREFDLCHAGRDCMSFRLAVRAHLLSKEPEQ